jgi:hypothetical protein
LQRHFDRNTTQLHERKYLEQQIIKEQISVKKVIEDKFYKDDREVSALVGGLLYTNRVSPDKAKKGFEGAQ